MGKLVKSSGRRRNIATISTSTDSVTDRARPASRMKVGRGMISTDSSSTTPKARPISVPGMYFWALARHADGSRSVRNVTLLQ